MEQPHKKIKKSASKTKFSSAELKYRRSSTTFAQNDNCVPHRLRDQPKKNKNNLKEYWTQLTIRMRETRRARFPIGFLIFSYPWFSHTYPHSNRICQSTRIRQISGLFVTQDSSGSIGN